MNPRTRAWLWLAKKEWTKHKSNNPENTRDFPQINGQEYTSGGFKVWYESIEGVAGRLLVEFSLAMPDLIVTKKADLGRDVITYRMNESGFIMIINDSHEPSFNGIYLVAVDELIAVAAESGIDEDELIRICRSALDSYYKWVNPILQKPESINELSR